MAKRGRKRKIAALMDEMIMAKTSDEADLCEKETEMQSLCEGISNCTAPAKLDGIVHVQKEELSFMTMVAISQAMNLIPVSFKNYRNIYISNILYQITGTRINSDVLTSAIEILQNNHGQKLLDLSTPPMEVLWQTTFDLQLPHTEYLGPPVIRCLGCDMMLEVHNAPTTVICHTLHGPVLALKITLRCSGCLLNYRYEQYGSERNGYRYYEQPRNYVKASRTTYIMRSLHELFIAAGHHTWCSFEGAAEVYNEMVRLSFSENATNTAKFLSLCPLRVTETFEKNNGEDIDCLPYELNRKLVAEAFWNAESEMELRETKNIGHSFLSVSGREDLMKETDHKRAKNTYPHNVCSDECKKRGCGTLWSCDGNWKLTYPICMFDTPKELSGFSGQLNYVAACPNQPENGEAFCEEHKEKAKSLGIPTILGEYVNYKRQNSRDIGLAGKKAEKKVDLHAASDCQGTTGIIDKFPEMSADLDDEDSSSKPSCNKETGEKKRIQR